MRGVREGAVGEERASVALLLSSPAAFVGKGLGRPLLPRYAVWRRFALNSGGSSVAILRGSSLLERPLCRFEERGMGLPPKAELHDRFPTSQRRCQEHRVLQLPARGFNRREHRPEGGGRGIVICALPASSAITVELTAHGNPPASIRHLAVGRDRFLRVRRRRLAPSRAFSRPGRPQLTC